jgi:redox-sensitive bicupin YhaK (pirin superfamily)
MKTKVILGSFEDVKSPIATATPVTVLHVELSTGKWSYSLPACQTAMLYVRKGCVRVTQAARDGLKVETHQTAFFEVILRVRPP